MSQDHPVERVQGLRSVEGPEPASGQQPVAGPSKAAARAAGAVPTGSSIRGHDLDRMAEWHDPATALFLEQAGYLRQAARASRPLSLLGSVLGGGDLPGVPKSWLLAGDLLAVGSLIAGCTLTAMTLGPAGILATMAMEAMAYAGGLAFTQGGAQTEKAQRAALLQSAQDPSRGLMSQAASLEILEEEFQASRKSKQPLAVMLVEVDQFDPQSGGLPPGLSQGEVLNLVAARVRTALREEDGLGLHGPSRLVVVAPGFAAASACLVAERVRLAVASEPLIFQAGTQLAITLSMGVATTELAPLAEVPGLLKRAAQALYRACSRGRNRVVVAGFR